MVYSYIYWPFQNVNTASRMNIAIEDKTANDLRVVSTMRNINYGMRIGMVMIGGDI